MVCKFCGAEIGDAKVCPKCGYSTEEENAVTDTQAENETVEETEEEKVPFSLKLISFFIPLVGIILYFVNRKDNERQAKACIKAAVISIAISIAFSIIMTIATIGLSFAVAKDNALTSPYVDSQYEDIVDIGDSDADFDVEEDTSFSVPAIE